MIMLDVHIYEGKRAGLCGDYRHHPLAARFIDETMNLAFCVM